MLTPSQPCSPEFLSTTTVRWTFSAAVAVVAPSAARQRATQKRTAPVLVIMPYLPSLPAADPDRTTQLFDTAAGLGLNPCTALAGKKGGWAPW